VELAKKIVMVFPLILLLRHGHLSRATLGLGKADFDSQGAVPALHGYPIGAGASESHGILISAYCRSTGQTSSAFEFGSGLTRSRKQSILIPPSLLMLCLVN
jgi:hypothetical protein